MAFSPSRHFRCFGGEIDCFVNSAFHAIFQIRFAFIQVIFYLLTSTIQDSCIYFQNVEYRAINTVGDMTHGHERNKKIMNESSIRLQVGKRIIGRRNCGRRNISGRYFHKTITTDNLYRQERRLHPT